MRRKNSAEFDARKFDFITRTVKRVTIRILMGRLPRLKASSDNEISRAALDSPSTQTFPPHRRRMNVFEGFIGLQMSRWEWIRAFEMISSDDDIDVRTEAEM